MINTEGKYYLGRIYHHQKDETTNQPLLYDPDDLTTHAVVVGMTGSGKTGLCIDLLEEAALQGVPALMIDPKGDITNTLLHFPDLLPSDFQPWVNPDEARREGKSIEQAAEDAASLWSRGLAEWDIGPERLRALQKSAQFAVYTPGSDAGIPVSILASLKAPEIPWETNREALREKISGTVTALLGLVGLKDIDAVQSREHILISNIFEDAWSRGEDLDLGELILKTQNPPFDKLGVFDVDTFFPEKERFELAMLLNNILAAPTFGAWIEGQPLEIPSLLYNPEGRPRHSVFYIAHLPDAERMFFVTLLYAAVETWMRAQSGSTSLRAILYFDEIFGYLPPVSNPPSKGPMLRMLKMARAFGVSQVLVTQNPVDIDYKALSNAGSWFVGKLQTERDKQRLLDGLQGAAPGLDRSHYDDLISTLDKRVFLLHNVHEDGPQLFKTRWAMNYLTGPLTRAQIPGLNELAGASISEESVQVVGKPEDQIGIPEIDEPQAPAVERPLEQADVLDIGSTTRPQVPARIDEYFLPNTLTFSQAAKAAEQELPSTTRQLGLLYRPVLLAQAEVRILQRKYNLNYQTRQTALVREIDRRAAVRWEQWVSDAVEPGLLDQRAVSGAKFATLDSPLDDAQRLRAMKTDFQDWVYHNTAVIVRANEALEVYAGPEVSQAEFRKMCTEAARDAREEELDEVRESFEEKIERLEDRLKREQRELSEDEAELHQRKMEEMGTHAENILSLFGGRSRRRVSTSLSKRRMTQRAKADVDESQEAIEDLKEDIADLEVEAQDAIQAVSEKWSEIANEVSEIPVAPYKKDILVDLFGVAWFPFHVVDLDGQVIELPGFKV
jgi:hypothetical protein